MKCLDCSTAAERAWHGFAAGCKGCAARAVARGHNFARVRKAGQLDRTYRAELDALDVTHDEVKAAHAADALGKATA